MKKMLTNLRDGSNSSSGKYIRIYEVLGLVFKLYSVGRRWDRPSFSTILTFFACDFCFFLLLFIQILPANIFVLQRCFTIKY